VVTTRTQRKSATINSVEEVEIYHFKEYGHREIIGRYKHFHYSVEIVFVNISGHIAVKEFCLRQLFLDAACCNNNRHDRGFLRKKSENAFPRKWLNRKINGTTRKCFPMNGHVSRFRQSEIFWGNICIPPSVSSRIEIMEVYNTNSSKIFLVKMTNLAIHGG
jgi:hypothetical protein